MYSLTAAGQARVAEWLSEVSWPKPDVAEFHLKLIAASTAGLADPVGIIDAQRRELLRRLRDAQEAAMAEPEGSQASLLLEGIVLRLQADLRWLEACEAAWSKPAGAGGAGRDRVGGHLGGGGPGAEQVLRARRGAGASFGRGRSRRWRG